MKKLHVPLSLAALALAGGCSTLSDPAVPAPAPVTVAPGGQVINTPTGPMVQPAPGAAVPLAAAPSAIRPGWGRIESITPHAPAAGTGGSTMRRIGVRMDDGTIQYLDTAAAGLALRERVQLTSDGHIRH
jgi:hypothetical protein